MFDELRCIRHEQVNCNRGLARFEKYISAMQHKMEQVVQVTNNHTDFLKTLAYRSIDMEARSRRNNLTFRRLSENRCENCFSLIRDFISNHLDIDSGQMYLARTHRLGSFSPARRMHKRAIIVTFRDSCDTELIMSKVTLLRDTIFSIDNDFPKEIQAARSRSWPTFKQIKREYNTLTRVLKVCSPRKLSEMVESYTTNYQTGPKLPTLDRLTSIDRNDPTITETATIDNHGVASAQSVSTVTEFQTIVKDIPSTNNVDQSIQCSTVTSFVQFPVVNPHFSMICVNPNVLSQPMSNTILPTHVVMDPSYTGPNTCQIVTSIQVTNIVQGSQVIIDQGHQRTHIPNPGIIVYYYIFLLQQSPSQTTSHTQATRTPMATCEPSITSTCASSATVPPQQQAANIPSSIPPNIHYVTLSNTHSNETQGKSIHTEPMCQHTFNTPSTHTPVIHNQIGRASCRERV